jgi:hypothetical protein
MTDGLSTLYRDLLGGTYDCVRIPGEVARESAMMSPTIPI